MDTREGIHVFHRDDQQESLLITARTDVFDALLSRRIHCHDLDNHEAHLSTPFSASEARARFPRAYAHARRSRRAIPAAPERARAAHRLTAASP